MGQMALVIGLVIEQLLCDFSELVFPFTSKATPVSLFFHLHQKLVRYLTVNKMKGAQV